MWEEKGEKKCNPTGPGSSEHMGTSRRWVVWGEETIFCRNHSWCFSGPVLWRRSVLWERGGISQRQEKIKKVLLVVISPDICLKVFFLSLYSQKMFSQGGPFLILSLLELAFLLFLAPVVATEELKCPSAVVPMIWVSSLAVFNTCSLPLVWKQFHYSSVSICGFLPIILLGFVAIPNLENSQPLSFKHCLFPSSVLALSGAPLKSVFGLLSPSRPPILRPLSMKILGDWGWSMFL